MKKLMLLVAVILFFGVTGPALSGQIGLQWDANTEVGLVAGYRVFMRTSGQTTYDYTTPYAVAEGITTTTVYFDLPVVLVGQSETFFFVLRAYSFANIESDDSDEVSKEINLQKPSAPKGCSIIK